MEKEKISIDQHNLELWPGYMADTRLLADGIFLNVDTRSKFITKTSVLELINEMLAQGKTKKQISDIYDSSNIANPRQTVITAYNPKQYQVDGLVWDVTP